MSAVVVDVWLVIADNLTASGVIVALHLVIVLAIFAIAHPTFKVTVGWTKEAGANENPSRSLRQGKRRADFAGFRSKGYNGMTCSPNRCNVYPAACLVPFLI